MNKKYKVTEIFNSIQGEGKFIGKPSTFIRFYGCNESCKWCDSPYAIKGGEYKEFTYEELTEEIKKIRLIGSDNLVITGGEPLIQLDDEILEKIVDDWDFESYEIETNGILLPKINYFNNYNYNISPKLFNDWEIKYKDLNNVLDRHFLYSDKLFKFVAEHGDNREQCLSNILKFIDIHSLPSDVIYIMTEGTTIEEQTKEKMQADVEFCLKYGFNYTPRLHIMIWDKKRKV